VGQLAPLSVHATHTHSHTHTHTHTYTGLIGTILCDCAGVRPTALENTQHAAQRVTSPAGQRACTGKAII